MARMSEAAVRGYIERGKKGGWIKREQVERKAPQQKRAVPDLEGQFEHQLKLCKIAQWVREHRFCERRWRFDFCWPQPQLKLAVEIEGGIHTRGRHVRPEGFRKDAAKYNRAAILGWIVLRVTAADIRSGDAIRDLEHAIRARSGQFQVQPNSLP